MIIATKNQHHKIVQNHPYNYINNSNTNILLILSYSITVEKEKVKKYLYYKHSHNHHRPASKRSYQLSVTLTTTKQSLPTIPQNLLTKPLIKIYLCRTSSNPYICIRIYSNALKPALIK